MNTFSGQFIDNRTVLNEILTGQWLMSYSGLLQLGHFFQHLDARAQAPEVHKEERQLLSFFNEDYVRIMPRSVDEIPEGTTAMVNMVGPMTRYSSWWMLGANEVVWQLDFLNNIKNVSAIVGYIDGPGGAVGALPLFQDFAKRKKKPIVTLANNSLSLHKFLADVISDYQMAENDLTSRFGSYGVVSTFQDATEYYEKLGVKIREEYPDESKHKNEIWRAYKKDEEKGSEMLKSMILSPMAKKLQNIVTSAHPNLIKEEGVLTGRTFGTEDAIRIGMINKQGNMMEAMQIAKALAEAYSIN